MRKLNEIMSDVKKHWRKPYFGAVPYIEALSKCENISDTFGFEDCVSLVNYFLANATYFRGEKAREIKKELNEMIQAYQENPYQFPEGKIIKMY